jgi:hypothetical protein
MLADGRSGRGDGEGARAVAVRCDDVGSGDTGVWKANGAGWEHAACVISTADSQATGKAQPLITLNGTKRGYDARNRTLYR